MSGFNFRSSSSTSSAFSFPSTGGSLFRSSTTATPATSSSPFGFLSNTASSSSSSAFATPNPNPSSSSPFSSFGVGSSAATAPAFGFTPSTATASSPSLFGSSAPATSLFGAPASTGSSIFGSAAPAPSTTSTPTSNPFGATTSFGSNTGSSLFGSSSSSTPSTNLFGSAQSSPAPSAPQIPSFSIPNPASSAAQTTSSFTGFASSSSGFSFPSSAPAKPAASTGSSSSSTPSTNSFGTTTSFAVTTSAPVTATTTFTSTGGVLATQTSAALDVASIREITSNVNVSTTVSTTPKAPSQMTVATQDLQENKEHYGEEVPTERLNKSSAILSEAVHLSADTTLEAGGVDMSTEAQAKGSQADQTIAETETTDVQLTNSLNLSAQADTSTIDDTFTPSVKNNNASEFQLSSPQPQGLQGDQPVFQKDLFVASSENTTPSPAKGLEERLAALLALKDKAQMNLSPEDEASKAIILKATINPHSIYEVDQCREELVSAIIHLLNRKIGNQKKLEHLVKSLHSLPAASSSVNALRDRICTLEVNKAKIWSEKVGLDNQVLSAQYQYDCLQQKKKAIENLKQEIAELEGKIARASAEAVVLEEKIDRILVDPSTIEIKANELEDTELAIGTAKSELTGAKASLDNHKHNVERLLKNLSDPVIAAHEFLPSA